MTHFTCVLYSLVNVPTLNKEATSTAAAAPARNATSAAKLVILLVTALREAVAVEAKATVVEEEATAAAEASVTRPGKSNKVNLPVRPLTPSSSSATLAVELVTCRATAFRDQSAITATEL